VLVTLAYVSRSRIGSDPAGVAHIARRAARRNAALGLTGALYFDDRVFFQTLEGPAEGLATVMERIARDPRHTDLRVLDRREVYSRLFEGWEMKLVDGARLAAPDLFAYPVLAGLGADRLAGRVYALACA